MFGLNLNFGPRKRVSAATAEVAGGLALYISISEMGWQAQLIGPDLQPVGERQSEDWQQLSKVGAAEIENFIGRAIQTVPRGDRRNLGSVLMLLDDPGIIIVDNHAQDITEDNPTGIRRFGAQQLNCELCSFGFWPFEHMVEGRARHGVYSFVNTQNLRNYLTRLESLAVKTTMVVPLPALMIQAAASNGYGAYCGVKIGAFVTTIVLATPSLGVVVVRTLPIGIMSLVESIAKANSVRTKDALSTFKKQDYISRISIRDIPNDPAMESNHERILRPQLKLLHDEIALSLEYFDVHRLGGRPEQIEIHGQGEIIEGLSQWLAGQFAIPIKIAERSLFDEFLIRSRENPLNLLAGAEGGLITIGKINYRFDEKRFVPHIPLSERTIIVEQSRRGRERGQKRHGQKGQQGRKTRGQPSRRNLRGRPAPEAGMSLSSEALYFALLTLVTLALIYAGYSQYEPVEKNFEDAAYAYASTVEQNTTLRQSTQAGEEIVIITADRVADKVLWSEKFLAMGRYMSNEMWLTDVYLTDGKHTINNTTISTKKLTMEGAVLPSTKGHIQVISDYIERLLEDKDNIFMNDFGQIIFEGATLDETETDRVVRFTIDAWYDKEKQNLRNIETVGDENASPLGPVQENTETP